MTRDIKVTQLGEAEIRPRNLAFGYFDGVHRGHRKVIEGADTVLTFDPHPLHVLRPQSEPKLLMPFDIKVEAIAKLGVDEIVVIPFDREFASLEPGEFIERVLIGQLGASRVSVGENQRFGRGATGTPELLRAEPRLDVNVVPVLEYDGEVVSSTRIRNLVAAGDVDRAGRCLGGPFIYEGEVVRGEQRGRELGFPTANLVPHEGFVHPAFGVYAALANGHPAAVSIGVRPTFDTDLGVLIEAHLIDVEPGLDLYGQNLRLVFLSRLRGERRFSSAEELIDQMNVDVELSRQVCATFIAEFGTDEPSVPTLSTKRTGTENT